MKNIFSPISWIPLFVSVFLLFSCTRSTKVQEQTFIISQLAKTDQKHFFQNQDFYPTPFNFIVDSNDEIHYYHWQAEGWDRTPPGSFTAPVFINLTPGKIVQVPDDCVIDFLRINVLPANGSRITIASQKDTIQSMGFALLYKFLTDSVPDVKFSIRYTTFEENMVLYYKQHKILYDPMKIEWDSTKVEFLKPPVVTQD